jgi:hypothetical protein
MCLLWYGYFLTVFETEFVYTGSDLSVSKSEYSISDTISIFEYLNHIFMTSASNSILSDIVDIIRIRI